MPVLGIDVSKWNYGWSYDRAVKPIDFIIQRASWSGYKDDKFDLMLPETQKVGVRGAYHYYSSGVNWKYQADLFLSVVKDKGFHFYVLDYETAYNNLNGRTIAEAAEFVKYVKAQTNKICMFYFSPNVYNNFIKPFGYTNWLNQQEIWEAQYPWTLTQTPPYDSPKLPAGVNSWRMWQFGASDVSFTAGRHAGPDYGQTLQGCDLNYFNGTIDELYSWAGITEQPPIDPPPVDPPQTTRPATVKISSLNVRSAPNTSASIIPPSLKLNDKIQVQSESRDMSNNIWFKFSDTKYACSNFQGVPYILYDNPIVEPPPVEPPLNKYATVVINSVNVRNSPSTSGQVIGGLVKNSKVLVEYETLDNSGNLWVSFGGSNYVCMKFGNDFYLVYDSVVVESNLYRIKDDIEAGIESEGGTRPFIRNGLPSTVRIRGGVGFVLLSSKWMDYLVKINNTKKSLGYQFTDWKNPVKLKPAVGYHNTGQGNRVEQLTFSGNIVDVIRVEDGKAYIKTFFNNENPPSEVFLPMPNSLHSIVHMFTTQYTGYLDMSTDSRYPRVFPIANQSEELWMDIRDLVKI